MCLPQVSHGHVTNWRACRFYTEPVHLSEKRFKKEAGFLPNAPKKKFGLRIARYFNRFPIFPLPAREVRWYKNTGSYPWYWNLGRTGELKTIFHPPKCHLVWMWTKISQSQTQGFADDPTRVCSCRTNKEREEKSFEISSLVKCGWRDSNSHRKTPTTPSK